MNDDNKKIKNNCKNNKHKINNFSYQYNNINNKKNKTLKHNNNNKSVKQIYNNNIKLIICTKINIYNQRYNLNIIKKS